MLLQRKLYSSLLEWKKRSKGKTAVLLEGARRTGKTTLAKEFAKREYESFLYIDFSHVDVEVLKTFENNRSDTPTLLRMLQLLYGVELKERNSLVIFDEVQRFPLAREEIKHLVEYGKFDFLETGSLISIRKNSSQIVLPSEEEVLLLTPLDFEEYLTALGRMNLADEIRSCYETRSKLPDPLHNLAMRLFYEYMLVGGMPKVVTTFIETSSFVDCDREKRQILHLYDEDIEKFGGICADRARGIWRQIPGNLSTGSKRFKFATVSKTARYRNYQSAINWLEDSRTVNICRRTNDPNVAFKLTEDEANLKCYMADTGLLVSHTFPNSSEINEIYKALQFGRVSVNKGMFVENVIAQELRAKGEKLFYYSWTEEPRHQREIDFLVTRGFSDASGKLRISPIEVKSSKSYSTKSLDDFKKHWANKIGEEYVLHPKQFKIENNRTYIPLYMSFCL